MKSDNERREASIDMIRQNAGKAAELRAGLGRREFLHTAALPLLGLGTTAGATEKPKDKSCIMLMLVGGPSQLDTWDMKPDAPAEIRGPYMPIRTSVPGIEISEIFPRMAMQARKYAIIRSLYHTGAAVHDTGHQLMQTGRLFRGGMEHPHIGCVVAKLRGSNNGAPAHVMLPHPIGNTGGNLPHGQDAGFLGGTFDPLVVNADPCNGDFASTLRADRTRTWNEAFELDRESESLRARYGMNRFGQSCLLARRLVEAGVRFATVNMFETVFDEITWDIHGSKPFSPMSCYRDILGPMFDMAYSTLLEDLSQRGLLDSTMVVASGEFGRTPRINPAGGRDHWTQCWSMLMAGGGVQGGQIIGASDAIGAEPKDRATQPAEIAASIYHAMGINPRIELPCAESSIPLVDSGVEPIRELFV